ncbi:MAG: helix-turn-helix domain-containing protein [Candidatus Thiodiazotropha sp. (ex Dulcina madagascariensis)]|nr:helix-turn-helix domain-containing protein [Candidatus Thiodiazotropha sp. (ex Dulcina madagascariensis)]
MSLAATLRELRAKKKASLQKVADAVGVSKPHIWELEKGKTKNPSLDLLKALAKYFEVSLDYLAGFGQDEAEPHVNALLRKIDSSNLTDNDWKVIESSVEFALKIIEDRDQSSDDTSG